MTLLLIDVSSAQGHIDWSRVARWIGPNGERVAGAIIKASTGNGITGLEPDPRCAENSAGALTVGLLLGWYHFADPDTVHASDPVAEATHLVAVAEANGFVAGSHMLVLDIEEARNIHAGPAFASWVLTFCQTVEARGVRPVIYTGGPFWNSETTGADAETLAKLTSYPLWLASYVRAAALPSFVPHGWAEFLMWQRSGDQAASDSSILHVDGIATNVDRDEFEGSVEELHARIAAFKVDRPTPIPSTLPEPGHDADHALQIDAQKRSPDGSEGDG